MLMYGCMLYNKLHNVLDLLSHNRLYVILYLIVYDWLHVIYCEFMSTNPLIRKPYLLWKISCHLNLFKLVCGIIFLVLCKGELQ